MNEIDDMDFLGYLKVRSWEANREHSPKKKKAYIDEVWPNMSSH